MGMVSTNDLRRGMVVEIDGELYQVVESQHVKIGRGGAFVKAKLRKMGRGGVVERTLKAEEKIPYIELEEKLMVYLYRSGEEYWFMDKDTFDQIPLKEEEIGNAILYLKENMDVKMLMHKGKVISIEPPTFVELRVVETDPGLKGDRVTAGTKPAKLETGLIVQVPLFVQVGDVVRIDTRDGSYIERSYAAGPV